MRSTRAGSIFASASSRARAASRWYCALTCRLIVTNLKPPCDVPPFGRRGGLFGSSGRRRGRPLVAVCFERGLGVPHVAAGFHERLTVELQVRLVGALFG